MLTLPPIIISFDVYYGSEFRSDENKEYDYTRASKALLEPIDVRDFGLQDLFAYLKANVAFEHTDVLYYARVSDPAATYLRTEEQWNEIKETVDERENRLTVYLVMEDEETLGWRYVDEANKEEEEDVPTGPVYDTDGRYFSDSDY